ncbi:hypothetical protein Pelo_5760 [Pelomyxa schiedti]|nr:hypothetical protein Pelo_5760 [Pelomyxa schiedti]
MARPIESTNTADTVPTPSLSPSYSHASPEYSRVGGEVPGSPRWVGRGGGGACSSGGVRRPTDAGRRGSAAEPEGDGDGDGEEGEGEGGERQGQRESQGHGEQEDEGEEAFDELLRGTLEPVTKVRRLALPKKVAAIGEAGIIGHLRKRLVDSMQNRASVCRAVEESFSTVALDLSDMLNSKRDQLLHNIVNVETLKRQQFIFSKDRFLGFVSRALDEAFIQEGTHILDLPLEVLLKILDYLPLLDLLKCSHLCKSLHSAIEQIAEVGNFVLAFSKPLSTMLPTRAETHIGRHANIEAQYVLSHERGLWLYLCVSPKAPELHKKLVSLYVMNHDGTLHTHVDGWYAVDNLRKMQEEKVSEGWRLMTWQECQNLKSNRVVVRFIMKDF